MSQPQRGRPAGPGARRGLLSGDLETVLEVARTGSFSLSARSLGANQSTVSRRIRNLEDRIGVSLFERSHRGVSLTHAGRAFVVRVEQAQDQLRTALTEAMEAGTVRSGQLSVGFVWSFTAGLAQRVLGRFREMHSAVRLRLTEMGAAGLQARVISGELDCAWTVLWTAADKSLICERLWSEPLWLASPAALGLRGEAAWTDLGRLPFLCRASDDWQRFQHHLDTVEGPVLDIRPHDCSHESLLSLVAGGDGLTVMPQSIAIRPYPGVAFRRLSDPRAVLEIHAMYRREVDNPALRRFLAVARRLAAAADPV